MVSTPPDRARSRARVRQPTPVSLSWARSAAAGPPTSPRHGTRRHASQATCGWRPPAVVHVLLVGDHLVERAVVVGVGRPHVDESLLEGRDRPDHAIVPRRAHEIAFRSGKSWVRKTMCTPFVGASSRVALGDSIRRTSSIHGPAALTMTRPCTVNSSPLSRSTAATPLAAAFSRTSRRTSQWFMTSAGSRGTLHRVDRDARVICEHVDVAPAADQPTRVEVRLLSEHAARVEHAVPALEWTAGDRS